MHRLDRTGKKKKKKKNLKKGKGSVCKEKLDCKKSFCFMSFELVGRIEVTKLILFVFLMCVYVCACVCVCLRARACVCLSEKDER